MAVSGEYLTEDAAFLKRQEAIQQVNMLALEHFLLQHKVVLRKLMHAQSATKKSIRDLEQQCAQAQGGDLEKLSELQAQAKKYDALWSDIIQKFKVSCTDEKTVSRVERILSTIPRMIRKIYDMLISQDSELRGIIKELASEKYKKALAAVRKAQGKKDLMSGIDIDEFDDAAYQDYKDRHKIDAALYETDKR
ncbi:MAG: hypothetical protein KDJ35_04650 [Alphaproteobacteria bacterium]|nr:hypothetical protein [Alphaproteobacteria bacterium]